MFSLQFVLFTTLFCGSILHARAEPDNAALDKKIAENCRWMDTMKLEEGLAETAERGKKLFCAPNDLSAARAYLRCNKKQLKASDGASCKALLGGKSEETAECGDLAKFMRCGIELNGKNCGDAAAGKIIAWELERENGPAHKISPIFARCKDVLLKELRAI